MTCFDCGKRFEPYKQDLLCPGCEHEERERQQRKGARGRVCRPRSLAGRVEYRPSEPVARPSLAMRLHGKRAAV